MLFKNFCHIVTKAGLDISKVALQVKPYFHRNNLYTFDGLIFYNDRVIVPKSLRGKMLEFLHEMHYGITKTQQRATQILYWPEINGDIENTIRECQICEKHKIKQCQRTNDIKRVSKFTIREDS